MTTITVKDKDYTLTDDVKIAVYYYKGKEPAVKLDGVDYIEITDNQTVSTIAADLSLSDSYYFGTGLMSDKGGFIPCSTQHIEGYSSVGITAISKASAKAFFGSKRITKKLTDKIHSLLWAINRESYDPI